MRPARTHDQPPSRSRRVTFPVGGSTDGSAGPSGGACPNARCGRWLLSCSTYSAKTARSCRHPKVSIRSSTSRRTVPTHRPPLRSPARRPHRRDEHFDRLGGNDRVERGRELPVPIADQEPELPDAVFEAHEQVAGLLRHPLSQWTRCHTEHVDPAGADLDHEQHLQPLEEHGVDGEQVHRQHTLGLRPQELPPWDGRPLRRWVNTSSLEDGPCGAGPDPGAESAQLSVDAAVAPGRVLLANRSTSSADLWEGTRTATPVRMASAASDQVSMPAQQCFWPDKQPVPDRAGKQAREPSNHRQVGPVDRWPGHPPPQYRDLVTQHQQLGVLGGRASCQQRKPSQYLAEQ